MTIAVRLPQWSMNMREARVICWLKCEGEAVAQGDELVEIEAAKAVQVIEAPTSGMLSKILVPEGETVAVRSVLCEIEPISCDGAPSAPAEVEHQMVGDTHQAQKSAHDQGSMSITPVARRLARFEGVDLSAVKGSGPAGRIMKEDVLRAAERARLESVPARQRQVEPRARKLARDSGVDLQAVTGSGPGGRVTEEDVRAVLEMPAAAFEGGIVPYEGTRKLIGESMMISLQRSAQVTLTMEADVTDLEQAKAALDGTLGVTYTDLMVKASALALREHPRLNARMASGQIHIISRINVGIAVALDEGLVVPVIRDADRKDLSHLARERAEQVAKARAGQLGQEDVTGGTFTVSNLGMYGVHAFTPILNPPEAAILGVGTTVERPTKRDGDLIWRKMMTLSLTFDHRIVDGAPAAAFLGTVKSKLEHPEWV